MKFWFLLVFFYMNIIVYIFKKYIYQKKWLNIMFHILVVISVIFVLNLPECGQGAFAFTNVLPIALMCYLIGFDFRKVFTMDLKRESTLVYLFLVLIILSQVNSGVLMFRNEYGLSPIFLLTAIMGTFIVIQVSKRVNSEFLIWAGVNSIVIYVLQCHLFLYSRKIVDIISGYMNSISNVTVVIVNAASILICLMMCFILTRFVLSHKKISFFFGK